MTISDAWADAYRKKNSYHLLSKADQRIIDALIDEGLKGRAMEDAVKKPKPTIAGEELITNWNNRDKKVRRLLQELDQARKDEAIAAQKVADWLKPSDAKDGETFHMWFGDSMLAITNNSVKIRLRGKSLC